MPIQSSKKSFIIPDGTKVNIKASGDVAYSDMGIVMGDVAAVVNWTANKIETGNALQINNNKDYIVNASFSMASIDPDILEDMSNGAITKVVTAASPNAAVPTQAIAAGWADQVKYPLILLTSSSDSTKLKMDTAPVLTSVVLDVASASEALTAWSADASGDYTIVADSGSYSGWSIIFNSASMATGSPTTLIITITYNTNTPRSSTTLHMGSSSVTAVAFELQFVTTDSDSKQRTLNLHSTTTDSGGLSFGFKSVNDAGLETIEVAMTAALDEDLTDGRQLLSWVLDEGVVST